VPSITAILHTKNDALRLGRALETLYPCDEVVVVDHASQDSTVRLAREYGARVVMPKADAPGAHYIPDDPSAWILCLDPHESLTEGLAASLFEWKAQHLPGTGTSFSVYMNEETAQGWVANRMAQTRLVPANWNRWVKLFPENDPDAVALEGELLRFVFP